MPSIANSQNEKKQLQRLAAQRYLYFKAKKIFGLYFMLAVPLTILSIVFSLIFSEIQIYATIYGMSLAIIGFFILTPLEKQNRLTAAKIQEIFDCDVLKLDWNEYLTDQLPDKEDIIENAQKYDKIKHKFSPIEDWYPSDIDQFPIALGRVICQRSNIWWDAKNRERYIKALRIILILTPILIVIAAIIAKLDIPKTISFITAPIMPLIIIGVQQYQGHKTAADNLNRLKKNSDALIKLAQAKMLNDALLTQKSRCLQDEIYRHRSQNPCVFEWLYKRFRNKDEDKMNKSAQEIINEIKSE